jgi:hypothetical protein
MDFGRSNSSEVAGLTSTTFGAPVKAVAHD